MFHKILAALKGKSAFRIAFISITVFSLLFIVLPFFFFNNLYIWDSAGHYLSAYYTKEFLFPGFSGWNPYAFTGFPQNYFYPPLFYWLAALIAQVMPLEAALKLLVSAAVLLTPYSFYFLARKFGFNEFKASMFMLFMYGFMFVPNYFFDSGAIGGNFDSTFNIGLLPNAFMLPFFFIALGVLREELRHGKFFRSGVLVAFCSLIHFSGFVLLLLAFGMALHDFSVKKLQTFMKVCVLSFGLSAFWFVSFLLFSAEYFTIIIFPMFTQPFLAIVVIALAAVSVNSFRGKTDEAESMFLVLVTLFFGAVFFNLQFHLARLFPYFFAIAALMVFKALEKPGHIAVLGVVAGMALALLFVPALNVFGIGGASFEAGKLPSFDEGRMLVVQADVPRDHHHIIRSLLVKDYGVQTSKGLFIESSLNSKFISDLELGLNSGSFVWGDYFEPQFYEKLSQEEKHSLIEKQLSLFGVSFIISNDANLSVSAVPESVGSQEIAPFSSIASFPDRLSGALASSGEPYYMYRLKPVGLFEPLAEEPEFFTGSVAQWRSTTVFWFFDLNRIGREMVLSAEKPEWSPASGAEKISLLSNSKSFDRFSFHIGSEKEVPVLVKVGFFPDWHAYSSGKEIPVYRASPDLMLVYAKGEVDFVFEKSPAEKISLAVSTLFLIFTVFMAVRLWREKKFL